MWIFMIGFRPFLSPPTIASPGSSTGGTCALFLPSSIAASWPYSSIWRVFSGYDNSTRAWSFDNSYDGGGGSGFPERRRRQNRAIPKRSANTATPPTMPPTMTPVWLEFGFGGVVADEVADGDVIEDVDGVGVTVGRTIEDEDGGEQPSML